MATASLLTILTHNPLSTFIFQVGSSLRSLGWPGTRLYNPSTRCFPSTGNASLPSAQLHLASLSRLFHTHLQPNKNWYYLKLSPGFLSLQFFLFCFVFREGVGECVWRRVCSISKKHFLIQFRLAWNPPCSPGQKSYLSLLSINTPGSWF